MIVLCNGCRGSGEGVEAEVLTIGFPGQCDVCGTPDRGENTAYRTDPRSPFVALMAEVDDICDWLEYEPSLETLEASLKKLNRARLRYLISQRKPKIPPMEDVGFRGYVTIDENGSVTKFAMDSVSLICPPESGESKS